MNVSGNSPKVNKLRGASVDDYVAKLSGERAAIVRQLRDLLRKAAPNAAESMKWGQPVYEDNGLFAYIKPAKNHVTLGFWRGTELTDIKGLLTGDGKRMRHVKLATLKDIDKSTLIAFIKQAVKLNHVKGSPSKREKKK